MKDDHPFSLTASITCVLEVKERLNEFSFTVNFFFFSFLFLAQPELCTQKQKQEVMHQLGQKEYMWEIECCNEI